MQQTDRTEVATNRTLWASVAVLFTLKLWLTSLIRTVPAYAPHDASNFLEHAKSLAQGHWFGPYNDLTLIKQPFFPMYLAIVQEMGVPLTTAHLILDAFASVVACFAIKPLVRSQAVLAVIFAVLYFDPFSFDTISWLTYRSQVNPALALLSVSCAFAIFVRRRRPVRDLWGWSAGLGAAFSAFWLTREEAVWLAPAIVTIVGSYVVWTWKRERSRLRGALGVGLVPVAMLVASVGAIMLVNGFHYGWFVTNEQQAPEFVSAYSSLARIDVPREPDFPISARARAIAYRVSPAARELEPALEGPLGAAWNRNACAAMPQVCGKHDIGGGWFLWAFRDAVAAAGHYGSAVEARSYYLRLAREIDTACENKIIACHPKGRSVFPAVRLADIPPILSDFVLGMQLLLGANNITFDHWNLITDEQLRTDYTFVVRSVEPDVGTHQFFGWLVHGPMKSIAIGGPQSESSQITFFPSPDVEQSVVGNAGGKLDGSVSRFEVKSFCLQACILTIVGTDGSTTSIPLSDSLRDFRSAAVIYHLDGATKIVQSALTDGFKAAALREIGRTYRTMFGGAFALSLLLLASRLFRKMRNVKAPLGDHVILTCAVVLSVSLLTALLAAVSVLAFPAFSAEYMGVMMPILLLGVCVALGTDGCAWLRLAVRLLPARRSALITA